MRMTSVFKSACFGFAAFAVTGCVADPGATDADEAEEVGLAEQALPTDGQECITIQRGAGPAGVTDAVLWQDTPEWSDGVNSVLSTGTSSAGLRNSLLQFDLSGVPAGASVVSASLSVNHLYKTVDSTVRVHRATSAWDESTVTWGSFADASDPTIAASFISGGGFGFRSADITALAQGWVSGAVPNYGVLIEEDAVEETEYLSSETENVEDRPKLDLCYLPRSCPFADLGSTVPQTVTGSTTGLPNDVTPSCGFSTASDVGYTFTAPADGIYVFDSIGSTYDTVLQVSDDGCSGPPIACNDDTVGLQSQVQVSLTAGQSVTIVVDGYSSSSGSYVLNLSGRLLCAAGTNLCNGTCVDLGSDPANCGGCGVACPAGDTCQAGTCVYIPPPATCPLADLGSTVPQTVTGSTTGRPNDATPSCAPSSASDAGYTFTAPANGTYTFDTVGSAFDTVLHVRDGGCSGPSIACNDDFSGLRSQVQVTLTAGQTVTVVVDGYSSGSGTYVLNVH